MTTKKIIAALKKKRTEMAKLRDELRAIEAEITDEADRAADALESLEYCIERLSETV